MKTYNTIYTSYEALYNFINENNIHDINNLIQVFCGCADKAFVNQVRRDILSLLPNSKIIGGTTRAEIFEGKSSTKTCVISISSFTKTEVMSCGKLQGNLTSFDMGRRIAEELYRDHTKAIIVFASSRMLDGEEFLEGVASTAEDVVIAGGKLGKNIDENEICIFTENEILEEGVVAVALNSEELYVNTEFNFGWIPIGKEHTITEADKYIIKSIDNIPAVEFYEKYMYGEKLQNLQGIANQFPLMVKRENDYACRNVVEILEDKYIALNYAVSEGEKVRFGYGNINHIVSLARETCSRIASYPVEALFIYSCIVRLRFLKDHIDQEMLPLQKDISISGFFTSGEFGHMDGKNRFLSQVMTVLTLSEEKNARISINENEFLKEEKADRLHNKILYNLIKISSDELEEVNSNLKLIVEEKTEEIKKQYYTDPLTNLPNRLRLIQDISTSTSAKLALIDIKSFNKINDFYGNKIGDLVLISFAEEIKDFFKNNAFQVYRVTSDVFAVFTEENIKDSIFIEKILALHMLLRHTVFQCDNQKIYINMDIGIAINKENLFEKASMALNYAKLHNKEFQIYNEELSLVKEYENNLEWIKKLKEAIAEDRIVPYYQPIYNNKTNRIEKYESLIRMIDEKGNVISPFAFLNIARRAHIYPQLTRIMINKTFENFRDKDFGFSINLLVEDIQNLETREFIYHKLSDKDMAKNVVFEIVESEGIENFVEVMEFINTVHRYGGKIAIDDFGTGYSNFKYLINLNIDYIKIDGSIIKNVCRDRTSKLVAETIVDFASKLGVDTVAEFVSDEEIHIKIREMGITFSQGYYFSEPKPNIC